MKAIITTTINVPHNVRTWRASGLTDEDVVIVAGDLKTPHDEVEEFLAKLPGTNIYLPPARQIGWRISEVIGWNSIQRRNIALLEAIRLKPKWILTIDDDNWPTTADQCERIDHIFNTKHLWITSSDSRWFDPGTMLHPQTSHRGFPIPYRGTPLGVHEYESDKPVHVGVCAMLWKGDPDVDAVTRLALGRVTTLDIGAGWEEGATVDLGVWAPFNTQAVAFRGELAPSMMVWPGVGRYDDIWASYFTRRIMDELGWYTYYGRPLVQQTRNDHDILKDLDVELFGMRHNMEVITALRQMTVDTSGSVADIADRMYTTLSNELDFLPKQTKDAFTAWMDDLETVL